MVSMRTMFLLNNLKYIHTWGRKKNIHTLDRKKCGNLCFILIPIFDILVNPISAGVLENQDMLGGGT